MTTISPTKKRLPRKSVAQKRSLLLRYVRAQAKRDGVAALDSLRNEIERYHSLNPRSEDARAIAHRFWNGLAIYDRDAIFSAEVEEGACDLVLTFECESACDYDLDELRPAFAEVGYDRVLVDVRGIADELHQLFVEMQRIATAYDRWQIEDDEAEDENDESEVLA